MKILITGGAGFVGSNLARLFKEDSDSNQVSVLDNLRRRGAETNLGLFGRLGIEFIHGDIRNFSDLEDLPRDYDLLIDASAEPSVLAGLQGGIAYLLQTNLVGTVNCLEFARRRVENFIFLSTSRVYSIQYLREIRLKDAGSRFEIAEEGDQPGISKDGISENFPTSLPRSLYGASKLASEMIIQEYAQSFGLRALINRCGVIAGPGQFGKTDQGVFTMWVANHYFKLPLRYVGFGGKGKQVRDLLHPADLYSLIKKQIPKIGEYSGEAFNVGGGLDNAVSLQELTHLCRHVTDSQVKIESSDETSAVDIPLYISDCRRVAQRFGWRPQRSVSEIVQEIFVWLKNNETMLQAVFAHP